MSCIFNTMMMGWITPEELDHVQSTYGDKFQKVNVKKRDRNGDWELAKDPKTGIPTSTIQEYTYLQNTETGELYFPDSPQLVALKCAAIAMGIPLYTIARMFYHVCRIAYLACKIFYESVCNFIEAWKDSGNGCEAFMQHMVSSLSCRIFNEAFLEQMWECIKAPYYSLGVFIAACEGLIHDPYKAKTEIAIIERHWNNGKTRVHDWRVQEAIHKGCWAGIMNSEAVFIALCMQPIGSDDQHVYSSNESRYLRKYEVIKSGPVIEGDQCMCPPCIPTACC